MAFEWDEDKNQANIDKHGVDFDEAKLIFEGDVLEFVDNRKDYGEVRVVAIGKAAGRELIVVYTIRGESLRIISARRASRNERRTYYETYSG